MPQMKPSDHPLVWFAGAAATVIAGTWALNETIRVQPLKERFDFEREKIETQRDEAKEERDALQNRLNTLTTQGAERTASDPIIAGHSNSLTTGGVRTHFLFSDPEGDANHISYVLVRSTARETKLISGPITPADSQKKGSQVDSNWACGEGTYSFTARAYITDAAGNVSKPHEFSVSCG